MRMDFKDLEYIALEGGGGKGAVYKGAIEALEELCIQKWKDGELFRIDKDGVVSQSDNVVSSGIIDVVKEAARKRQKPAILDFISDQQTKQSKIKGIAGSSAGAITAFPLSIGLNSEDIVMILKCYPFNEEFLPNTELHEGKYRMVGMDKNGNAKSLIAEDHFKKLGEDKIQHFIYSYQKKNNIGSNGLKKKIRYKVVSTIINVIFKGIQSIFDQIKIFFNNIKNYPSKVSNLIDINQGLLVAWNNIFLFFEKVFKRINDFGSEPILKSILNTGKTVLGVIKPYIGKKAKLFDLLPANNLYNSIGNLIWDRGIYAGFEVRDFFFKVLLLALSKDTHFKRSCITNFSKIKSFKEIGINEEKEIKNLSIRFNDKFEVEVEGLSKITLNKLVNLPELLTFEELYTITGINLCMCSTNATTNQPVYFSHYFTPNFPVIEALGASMNFPLAFKPIYNEANVIKNDDNTYPPFVDFLVSDSNTEIYKLYFNYNREDKKREATGDYNYCLNEILKLVKETYKLSMSVNGNLSFRSFLPYLKKFIEEKKWKDSYQKSLAYFYYNSAFKGLLIDGGVTNNLPTSIFTFTTDKKGLPIQDLAIKNKILSLKLDNSFPDELKNLVWNYFEEDKNGKTLERLTNWQDKLGSISFIKLIKKDLKLKNTYKRAKSDDQSELEDLSETVWIKICKELIEEYKLTKKGFTPWNKQVNAISALMSSLQFGMDQGHIEDISDNENIIPLCCYGVDTLDFDLTSKEISPLIELANKESKKQVINYFNEKKENK